MSELDDIFNRIELNYLANQTPNTHNSYPYNIDPVAYDALKSDLAMAKLQVTNLLNGMVEDVFPDNTSKPYGELQNLKTVLLLKISKL